jgi:hypothetical protein
MPHRWYLDTVSGGYSIELYLSTRGLMGKMHPGKLLTCSVCDDFVGRLMEASLTRKVIG